jgi:hypothetical protein
VDTEGCEDSNDIVGVLDEEVNDLREDLRRKRRDDDEDENQQGGCTSTATGGLSSSNIASAQLPDEQKVSLAILISVATMPGAYCSENGSRNASLHQLAEIARLRTAQ